MASSLYLYPPPPAGVPADLARPGWRYRFQVALVLLSLGLFLLIYLALLAGALALLYWAIWLPGVKPPAAPPGWPERLFSIALRVGVFILAAMLFVFLLKGLFQRGGHGAAGYLEVTEADQPDLFAF